LVLALSFLLNILAVLFFFKRKVSSDIAKLRQLIDQFNDPSKPAKNHAGLMRLREFKEIGQALKTAEGLRRKSEKLKARTSRVQSMLDTAQMIAHDLRRPLSIVDMAIQALGDNQTPQSYQTLRRMRREIQASLDSVSGVFDDLVEANSFSLVDRSPVDLRKILTSSLAQTQLTEGKLIPISWSLASKRLALGNARKLERVFTNIFSNAIDASQGNTSLEISLSEKVAQGHYWVRVKITNTNSTVPKDLLNVVFEPFVTYGKPKGSGLGLAIVKKIIEQHQGSVEIASNDLRKTVSVVVELPACEQVNQLNIDLPRKLPSEPVFAPSHRQKEDKRENEVYPATETQETDREHDLQNRTPFPSY